MMVARYNPFENTVYEQLIQNNLSGVVDLGKLGKSPLQVSKESMSVSDQVIELIRLMLVVDHKTRLKASQLLIHFKKTFKIEF
jgi:hypothetical protein